MSELRISHALALNEIVHAPSEFVSTSPHLVVAQLDWIQTRYLFVQTAIDYDPIISATSAPTITTPAEVKPNDPIEQDQVYTPRGAGGNLLIPKTALPGSRRPKSHSPSVSKSNKRQKTLSGSSASNPIDVDEDDDGASIATLDEDLVSTRSAVKRRS